MSTVAVENIVRTCHISVAAAERLPRCKKDKIMRIAETAAVGLMAIAAQILIAATVLL
jgi:hypothetical protein